MTAEEFLLDKWYSCVDIKHKEESGNIFMVYDPIWLRIKKLNSLTDDEPNAKLIKSIDTKILFYLDYKHHVFNIDYDIWLILDKQYKLSKNDCDMLIRKIIPDYISKYDVFKQIYIQSVSLNTNLIKNSI